MPWVTSKHVPACKCCVAPAAPMLNDQLERRKNRERDDKGNLITFKSIHESGLVDCSIAALKRHVSQGHIEFVTAGEAAAAHAADEVEQESWEDLLNRTLGANWQKRDVDPDDIGRLQRAMYPRSILADIRAGRPVRISHDQVNRSIAETTKRKSDDFRQKLVLAMAQAASFTGELAPAPQLELEEQNPEDTDFEYVAPEFPVELTDGGFEEDEEKDETA